LQSGTTDEAPASVVSSAPPVPLVASAPPEPPEPPEPLEPAVSLGNSLEVEALNAGLASG